MELLDKSDPPTIPDGYCMSVAYACLLDIIRSISLVVDNNFNNAIVNDATPRAAIRVSDKKNTSEDSAFNIQLINSSWCGLLAALTLLLDARYFLQSLPFVAF